MIWNRALDSIRKVTDKVKLTSMKNHENMAGRRECASTDDDTADDDDSNIDQCLPQRYTRNMFAPHVRAAEAFIALASETAVPASLTVESVHVVAFNVLLSLAENDSTLKRPAGQLKLWGLGRFERGPLNLDTALNIKEVSYPPLKGLLLEFLVQILLHEGETSLHESCTTSQR